jgi:glycosyltransferase involved in cell wall biosynthesis
MKILFLTDNFPPEVNAPATRTFEHCREWVKNGAEVTVITCAPNFPRGKVFEGYQNQYSEEEMDGIHVIRVRTYIAANKGTVRRSLDYLSFYFAAVHAGRKQNCDVILGTSPQFFTALAAKRLSAILGKPWVMEVRDIWPESIKTLEAVKDGPLIRFLEKKEKECYQSASGIVCVTRGILGNLIDKGVPEVKIRLFTNGARMDNFRPREKDHELLKKLGLEGKKVIGYLGTMGMSHKLDFILRCVKDLREPDLHFLLVGEGAEKENLLNLKQSLDLKNVSILDAVGKKEVPDYLSLMDIGLVNLRRSDLFLGALPSKIFEYAAMGKPLLLGLRGEAEKIIAEYPAGLAFEPENAEDFQKKLHILLTDKEFYVQCEKGSLRLAADYDRSRIAQAMLAQIREWSAPL